MIKILVLIYAIFFLILSMYYAFADNYAKATFCFLWCFWCMYNLDQREIVEKLETIEKKLEEQNDKIK